MVLYLFSPKIGPFVKVNHRSSHYAIMIVISHKSFSRLHFVLNVLHIIITIILSLHYFFSFQDKSLATFDHMKGRKMLKNTQCKIKYRY